ncbi:hypothetical protein [Caldicellulosiruptor morganii]|uniref:Mobilization protein n=1 Tax=Caldicellulosiruptor morganii TaxID=1387555 RepID=A0ABY7BPV8_9FIRM|nr:hypothetical protein [Caldicellulosiruptor morganii]WAM33810.1 hypothetical protein OTK00_002354 [Caldicellulosiruptor morganii]
MAKNLEEKLKNIDEKISQLKAQKQLIQNKLKEQERKKRTKKLIEIGAIFYSAGIKDQEPASKVKELILTYILQEVFIFCKMEMNCD